MPPERRLAVLHDRVHDLIVTHEPDAVALESLFFGQNVGTAFAVGDKATAGQANLLTNFHVVEAVWNAGNRRVFLERGRTELTATIVKVNPARDLALLRASAKVRGLTPDAVAVKPGQQVVVVAAGFDHAADLARLRRFIREYRPRLVGVGAGPWSVDRARQAGQ